MKSGHREVDPSALSSSYGWIWRIAYPVIVSNLAHNIVALTDTAFLGRVGEVELGAVALAGVIYSIMIMICFGMAIGVQILIARRVGENNRHAVGSIFDHSLYLQLSLSFFLFLCTFLFSTDLVPLILSSPEIINATVQYMEIRSFGLIAIGCFAAFRAYFTGIAQTRVIIWSAFLMSVINVFLDYALIFGHFGIPAMGINGAALASAIADWCGALFLLFSILQPIHRRTYDLFRFSGLAMKWIRSIISMSLPLMVQMLISLGGWLCFFVLIEHQGEQAIAVSSVIKSYYWACMMMGWGISTAVTTMVSNLLGQGKAHAVPDVLKKALRLAMGMALIPVGINILMPYQVMSVFTDDPALIHEAVGLLPILNVSLLIFPVSTILFHSILGFGKTVQSMCIEASSIIIYLVTAYVIAVPLDGSLPFIWTSDWLYWSLDAIFCAVYLRFWMKRHRITWQSSGD